MRLMRYMTGVALAALVAGSAIARSAAPQAAPAAGMLNPAAEDAPQTPQAPQAPFQLADGIVATVNDQIITGLDLRQRMLMLIIQTQVQPTEENLPSIQQEALNRLIEERLQMQELTRYDVQISDQEVNAELAAMAREAGITPEDYLVFLQRSGIRPDAMRENLRTEIGWQQLVSGRFGSRSRVSRNQVEQAMRQITEAAAKPQYLIGEIYIEAARVGGMQEAVNGATQLVQQMVQGAPFQAVARQFSAAPSAVRGGDAGWVVQGSVTPTLQQALDTLEVGQLSNPIPVEGGVYIIYMRDKRTGAATNLVQMKQIMVEVPETASEADVAAATQRLEGIRASLTCENILQRATSEQGLLGADLGESDVQNLAPQFQQIARSAEVGTVSSAVRTPLGVHLLAVCGRRAGGPEAPSYGQVENRLRMQTLSTFGRRYIRDLRADALIEIK